MPPLKPGYVVGSGGNIVSPAQQALRGTTASSILNRANIREDRAPLINALPSAVYKPPSSLNNANTREGRSGIAGVGTAKPFTGGNSVAKDLTSGVVLDNNNQTLTTGGDAGPVVTNMPPAPTPPRASDLGVVKNPARDLTDIRSLVPNADESTITRLLFEQFSAVEIAQLLTPRTVDGIDQKYSVISNLSDIRRRYNSTKQLTIMDKLAPISGVFAIDIVSKIPGQKYIENNNLNTTYEYLDENDQIVYYEKGFIYIDTNGDLVIEFENMRDDEIIQVQIDSNGTIYEVTNLWLQILEKISLLNTF